METGAKFSPCRLYRYSLWRVWKSDVRRMVFLLLNPSTADETKDDPTIRRCITRAINGGFGGVEIINLFAWRSTYPMNLYQVPDPIGPENNASILGASRQAGVLVCGWGKHGALHGRDKQVLELLRASRVAPHALKLNAGGSPQHPLYLSYDLMPFPMVPSAAQNDAAPSPTDRGV